MTPLERAIEFATAAHQGQVRKYTGEDYVTHPIAVSKILAKHVDATQEMLIAAVLHDTVEDTSVTFEDIQSEFGQEVSRLVFWVTKVAEPHHGNRATRKQMDLEHYACGPAQAQDIKVADIWHNSLSIQEHDPAFWTVFQQEKIALLQALTLADRGLWQQAWNFVTKEII